jgi:Actinobacteria/chloroflexi VLRF1 release factor
VRPAAGGGRWVEVAPERLARWLAGFDERHGVTRTEQGADVVRFAGADGAVAECHVPFPPLEVPAGGPADGFHPEPLVAHACARRVVAVLLVRANGHAAGVFDGDRLVASKVGSRLVHGRSAAGGWSQQRFARRREGQLREAQRAAADDAARVLLPHAGRLDAVVRGGDRRALDAVLADPRLAPLVPLVTGRVLSVPDPKLAVLARTPAQFRATRIRLEEPAVG